MSCPPRGAIIPVVNRYVIIPLLVAALSGGCLERRLTITSDPEGALVFISDKEVGRTPVTTDFTWHGRYDIILRYPEEGYRTIKTSAGIYPKWYEWPPLDLLSHMAPWTYRDHRHLHYRLTKLEVPDDDVLIRRADGLRRYNAKPVKK